MKTTTEQLAEALRVALIRLDGHIKQDADGRDGDGANIDDLDAGEAARAALARYDAEQEAQSCDGERLTPAQRWERAKAQLLAEVEVIDKETPWSNAEPSWWLHMMATARAARSDAERGIG